MLLICIYFYNPFTASNLLWKQSPVRFLHKESRNAFELGITWSIYEHQCLHTVIAWSEASMDKSTERRKDLVCAGNHCIGWLMECYVWSIASESQLGRAMCLLCPDQELNSILSDRGFTIEQMVRFEVGQISLLAVQKMYLSYKNGK